MANNKLSIRLWDVEHGLAIWIQTPNGQNHWIDTGKIAEDPQRGENGFDPAGWVKSKYGVKSLDYLIITHPDEDHYNGLPELSSAFYPIKVLCRNKEFINNRTKELFGKDNLSDADIENLKPDKQTLYSMHKQYNQSVDWNENPQNPEVNGGVTVQTYHAPYTDNISVNNASIIVFYKYKNRLFVVTGDIEKSGWDEVYNNHKVEIDKLIRDSDSVVLVAPHHGRESGYIQEMVDILLPTLILVSDKYGKEPTDPRFYNAGYGDFVDGEWKSFASTKTSGMIYIEIDQDGLMSTHTAL